MITVALITGGASLLVGGVALFLGIRHALEGHEDALGFHECVRSRSPGRASTAGAARRRKCAVNHAYGIT